MEQQKLSSDKMKLCKSRNEWADSADVRKANKIIYKTFLEGWVSSTRVLFMMRNKILSLLDLRWPIATLFNRVKNLFLNIKYK